MKKDLKVGDVLLVALEGINSSRYARNKGLPIETYKGEVTKIGRKYFWVKFGGSYHIRFNLTDWKQVTEYSKDYFLYESQEEYDLKVKREEIEKHLLYYFRSTGCLKNLTIDQLEKIQSILDEKLD